MAWYWWVLLGFIFVALIAFLVFAIVTLRALVIRLMTGGIKLLFGRETKEETRYRLLRGEKPSKH
ncbi:hypothetical protein [Candidatus Darwinibacter acetoxidans]|jgi:hypothetical protein|nr:hypothetical protein [Bacillota bacterium]